MKILMVASEATPFAKTGGLADVVGALPAALRSVGEDVGVVLPRYRGVKLDGSARVYDNLRVSLGDTVYRADVHMVQERGVPFYLVDSPALYDRDGLYGDADGDFPDNHVRFAFFARAALEIARSVFRPDILHCHDWQTGLVPAYLRSTFDFDPTFLGLKTVFTVHNLAYQGIFPKTILPEIALAPSTFTPAGLEFFGRVNFLKAGLAFSDALTTVSRTYAREIQTPEYGFGLDGVLRGAKPGPYRHSERRRLRRMGPGGGPVRRSPLLGRKPRRQSAMQAGPAGGIRPAARGHGARSDRHRLALHQAEGLRLDCRGGSRDCGRGLSLVALGTGEPEYEKLFWRISPPPIRTGSRSGSAFDNPLAHKIEAGADMFLMPSR